MPFNWKSGTGGGLGGAALGAKIGSVIPGLGTAIGAGLGGLAGLLSGGLSGNVKKDPKTGLTANQMIEQNIFDSDGQNQNAGFSQSPNKFSPEQQTALNALLTQGQTSLANPTAGFEPIETYARDKFKRESIPGLAERFTALGGSDTRGSSDFAGMLGGAQSEFDQGLASLRAQYGQQGQQNALNMLKLGLTPQNEQIYFGTSPSLGNQIAETGGNLLGQYLAGGGDFGLSGSRQNKKAQEQGSITSKTLDKDKLKLLAQLVAMNKMKKGV